MSDYSYTNGFLEQNKNGRYEGNLRIDGVDLSPIEGMFFQEEGHTYLWLKRKPILEYDMESQTYKTRHSEPRWESYLQKQKDGVVAYKGECTFLHFKYVVMGVWDKVYGMEKQKINFFVERLPMSRQTLINSINDRKRKSNG